jgi:hypothetical protein
MKNLKKLSRNDLKGLTGGVIIGGGPRAGLGGGGSGDTFRCCNTQTGSCGPCGGPGACDVGYELRSC